MSGFTVTGSSLRHPTLWAAHESVNDEPIFVLVHREGAVGLTTLDYIRDCAQQVHDGDLELEEMYEELYVKIPHSPGLERAAMGFSGKPGAIKLTITTSTPGVAWTCDL